MSDFTVPIDIHEPAAPGSLPKRIVEVFVAPLALFRRFGPKAPWVDVMLVTVVLSALTFLLIPKEVWVQTVQAAFASRPDAMPQGMSPDAMAGMQRGMAIGAAAIVPWIFLLVQSAILLVIFTMLMGGEATFRQYLAVGAHAAIVGAVGQLATLPLIISQGNAQASISLRALVPGMEGFLPGFLGVFNVFLVWQLALLALGVTAVNRRASPAAAFGIVFGILALIGVVAGLIAAR